MTSPAGPRRRRASGAPLQIGPRNVGAVRRSQLITTYGVGSMIAIDNESFIVTGIDSWNIADAQVIREHRLAAALDVNSFRLPPTPESTPGADGVRVRRFPDYYSCPKCRTLQPFRRFNSSRGGAQCGECEVDLVTSRFVLACDHGHLDDFPYWKWVHRGNQHAGGHCGGKLSLHSDGSTASLRSIVVRCSCGVPEVSMEGAFRAQVLRDLRIQCEGRSPWLNGATQVICSRLPRVMQRGSSSVWHPVVHSALTIPPWSEGINRLIEDNHLGEASEENIRWFFQHWPAKLRGTTIEKVLSVVRHLQESAAAIPASALAPPFAEIRRQEYRSLTEGNPEDPQLMDQTFVCEPAGSDNAVLRTQGVVSVMLVKRLREVRALAAFVRGATPLEEDHGQRQAPLKVDDSIDWLPAVEVSGEGVFLRLDTDLLRLWCSQSAVLQRSSQIRDNHLRLLRERTTGQDDRLVQSPVTPRFLLLHTLAHILINEWSLDGGYPASALRERLYVDNEMAGLLIYTATSDSAGSLGGLVAQGEPERLAQSLRSALERAEWCSNDPLCMEARSSGTDNLNLAACHACVLLPETSCERNNTLLDRAMVVGDLGFFSGSFADE
ncbi:MAG: DUF1998 domain-containing protein [Hamadaea sp.]|nr:DUF1998 domain-containing protein [Hamadaea sp.]NUT19445.1 DUF1998 domain-containing protein [Hamadaea sp.]